MNLSDHSSAMDPTGVRKASSESLRHRVWTGLVTMLIGLFIFTVGAKPEWFGLARSSGIGFVKITVFLFGLAIICLAGLVSVLALWKDLERSLLADIGIRLVGTGYVISVFAGFADFIGLGSESASHVPYFGPVQAAGVVIGQVVIATGFLMLIPYRGGKEK